MKKLCITFAVLGIILTLAGIAISAMFGRYSNDASLSRIFDDNSPDIVETNLDTTEIYDSAVGEVTIEDGDRVSHKYNSNNGIKGIKIDAYAANITVSNSYDGENVTVDCQNVDIKYYGENITDGILEISYKPENIVNIKDLINFNAPEIYIYIPEADSVELSLNAGDIYIYDLTMKKLTINTDAGEMHINNSTVTENTDIKMTAGELYINSCELNNISINKVAGDVNAYDSVMTGVIKLDSTAGDCYFELKGDVSDYYFKLDVTAGDISINDSPSVPDGNSASAPNSFYIKQTAGDCDISIN